MVCEGLQYTTIHVKSFHKILANPLRSYLFDAHSYLAECARRSVEKIKAKASVYIIITTSIKNE